MLNTLLYNLKIEMENVHLTLTDDCRCEGDEQCALYEWKLHCGMDIFAILPYYQLFSALQRQQAGSASAAGSYGVGCEAGAVLCLYSGQKRERNIRSCTARLP